MEKGNWTLTTSVIWPDVSEGSLSHSPDKPKSIWSLVKAPLTVSIHLGSETEGCWMLLAEDVWYDIYSNTHWESVFDVRRLFCLQTLFKEVPKTPTTGWFQNAPGQTNTDKYTPWATKWSIKGTFSPVHVCTTGQRLPKETTESQILFVTCSLLLIIKERDWLKLKDEVILFGICRSLAHIQT